MYLKIVYNYNITVQVTPYYVYDTHLLVVLSDTLS